MNFSRRAGAALVATLSLAVAGDVRALTFHNFERPAPKAPKEPKPAPPPSTKESPKEAAKDSPKESAAKVAATVWPQSHSDLRADPEIRFGTLPNGMRYAVQRQATPAQQASVRLWFGAGSLMETDAQAGLAHFLEHMAFNGSKSVPEGDMIKILERLGLAFGADTNASTGFDETVYKLDLPRTDAETIDTSLMLLRETAGNLTLDPASVERERGVVLSEERSSDTPAYRVFKNRLAYMLAGQRMPTRIPIGSVEVIKSAPASQIADFYRSYYRPERAVLVMVGDFDPIVMEGKIRARFADWVAQAPPGPAPDLGKVQPRKTEARVLVEPGAGLNIQIAWIGPPDLRPDSVAKRREELWQQLGLAVLNRRLSALGRSPTPPFTGAVAFKSDQARSAELTTLNVAAEPDRWREALAAVDQEQRRIVRFGVRQDELDREIEEARAGLKADAAGAASRPQRQIANEIVGTLNDQEVVTAPSEDLELFEAAVKGLKADTVSKAVKTVFDGQGPLLFMATPKTVDGGDQALLSEYAASQKIDVVAPAAPRQVIWPYESFGPPGKVEETRDVTDLDTVFVRFANGVRLTVKPTKLRDDEVLVRVNIGDGLVSLPKDRQSLAWAGSAFVEGGLKKITNEETERVLAAKVYGVHFGVAESAFVLSGATRTDDLPTEMQVLAAYVAEPGWRPEAFARLQNSTKTLHDQYESTDQGVMSRDLGALMHPGDRRFTFPSREDLAKAQLEEVKAQLGPHIAADPIEVVVVGDVNVDKVIETVARTFGALPPRAPAAPPPASQKQMAFPAPNAKPTLLTHKGRADQAIGYVAWPAGDFWTNPQHARDEAVLSAVLQLRLIDQLREAEGITYSPSASSQHSLTWTGWGYLNASVEVPPAKLDTFFLDIQKIAADLRTTPVGKDELERAKKPRIDAIEKSRLTNGYWLGELSGAQADPRRLDSIRQLLPGTERVTAADVQAAAQRVLRDDAAWKLEVRPQGK